MQESSKIGPRTCAQKLAPKQKALSESVTQLITLVEQKSASDIVKEKAMLKQLVETSSALWDEISDYYHVHMRSGVNLLSDLERIYQSQDPVKQGVADFVRNVGKWELEDVHADRNVPPGKIESFESLKQSVARVLAFIAPMEEKSRYVYEAFVKVFDNMEDKGAIEAFFYTQDDLSESLLGRTMIAACQTVPGCLLSKVQNTLAQKAPGLLYMQASSLPYALCVKKNIDKAGCLEVHHSVPMVAVSEEDVTKAQLTYRQYLKVGLDIKDTRALSAIGCVSAFKPHTDAIRAIASDFCHQFRVTGYEVSNSFEALKTLCAQPYYEESFKHQLRYWLQRLLHFLNIDAMYFLGGEVSNGELVLEKCCLFAHKVDAALQQIDRSLSPRCIKAS